MLAIKHVTGYAATGAAVLALTLAGCGGGGGGSGGGTSSTPSGGSSQSSGSAQSGTTGSATSTLTTANVAKLGTVVTDGKGYVLYRFDADSANPTKVSCYNTCATVWPAATTQGSVTTKGIDKSLVSTVKRTDGGTQITLAGWPLYRYSKDSEPKEAYGQGVDGTWFAVTPGGAKITTPASTAPTPTSTSTNTGGGGGS
jgi:predicted lipoprotein with Yx(FWY)xxD motif